MNPRAQAETTVLLVMSSRDPLLERIERQLEKLDFPRRRVGSLHEFQQLTHEREAPDVVITGISLPDGNWCDVLRSVVRDGASTCVLVCAQEADERLWSEAIWRGVHDVLVEPIAADHIRRTLESCNRLASEDRTEGASRSTSGSSGGHGFSGTFTRYAAA